LIQKLNKNQTIRLDIEKEIVSANLGYYTRFKVSENYHNSFTAKNRASNIKGMNSTDVNNDDYQHDPNESYRSNYENP
jgi:hypothetical protein